MELFKGQSLLEFTERFKTDLDCEEYLASIKWKKGYCCRKCGHTKYQVRKDFSRTCNICGDTESPTAGTLFHRLKFGLRKAFFICFEMTLQLKGYQLHKLLVVMKLVDKQHIILCKKSVKL